MDLVEPRRHAPGQIAIRVGRWLKDRLDAGADAFMRRSLGRALAVVLIGRYEEFVQVRQAVVH